MKGNHNQHPCTYGVSRDFVYLLFTGMPGRSHCGQLMPQLLCGVWSVTVLVVVWSVVC